MASKPQPTFELVKCTIHNLHSNPVPAGSSVSKESVFDIADDRLAEVHAAFKTFYATPRATNPRGYAHSIISRHYPNHYIINVNQRDFDFSEFAAAGHATEELDHTSIDVGREYKAPHAGRTYGQEAGVSEKVYWGRFKYTWKGNEFILYKVSWKYEYDQDSMWSFVLYPRAVGEGVKAKSEHIDDLLLAIGRYSSLPHEDIFLFTDNWTYRSKSMYHAIKNAYWDDVILDPGMKDALMKDVISFFQPATKDLYTRYSIPYKRGIILHGSPGNGKTITIKALINQLQRQADPVPTLYVKSMKDKCKGDQESLKRLFNDARRRAPILLVFEDLDSLISGEVRSHFLNEIDGLESNDGILFLGSTNHLDNIDSAIRSRPSRFDRKFAFNLPDHSARERYARYWRSKLASNDEIDFPEAVCGLAADLTVDFSFAYLKELFISTLLTVSKGVRDEDMEWDVVNDKSASGSDSGEEISTTEATQTTSSQAEETELPDKSLDSDAKKPDNSEADEKTPKKKRLVPKLSVPEELKKNVFLAILQQQAKLLINDMDNTDEEEAMKKKEKEKKKGKKDKGKKQEDDHSCSTC